MCVLIRKHFECVILLLELIMLKLPEHSLPLRLPLLLDLLLQVSLELINAHLSEVLRRPLRTLLKLLVCVGYLLVVVS